MKEGTKSERVYYLANMQDEKVSANVFYNALNANMRKMLKDSPVEAQHEIELVRAIGTSLAQNVDEFSQYNLFMLNEGLSPKVAGIIKSDDSYNKDKFQFETIVKLSSELKSNQKVFDNNFIDSDKFRSLMETKIGAKGCN